MADIQTQLPVKLTDNTNTVGITGSSALKIDISATAANATAIKVDGSAVTQPVSGTVSVTQSTASSLNATIIGSGSAGSPSTGVLTIQGIAGGTSVPVTFGVTSTGIVAFYATVATVANGSTGTITYTVTAGKTFYLKGVFASSSGAPCKVTVDYGAGPTVVAVGFYAAAAPFVHFVFDQPISIPASTAVNVKIVNNAGLAQDVYATIMGQEI